MLKPYFLKTLQGHVFIQSFVPEQPNGEAVIFVPPFAEEMNKSRRMMGLLGHSLAAKGVLMVIPDLYGTGDSEGGFSDARWSIWLDNVEQLVHKLKEQGIKTVSFTGLRMGCLLINDYISQQKSAIKRVVFWKPVTSGKQMVNQFLRLRVANSMMDGKKETIETLRGLLVGEGELEIAGYSLNADLIHTLDEKKISAGSFDSSINLYWFEVLASENQPMPMASTKTIQNLVDRGVDVNVQQFVGENFWANQEIAEIPELISVTSKVFCEARASGC